ncbi:galectin-1-like [Physella acuta]|uniref:galectin-1-like n=1 Tax=Physella acuta TaxID=109671 RepID=UPI0027DD32E3|nr:galectin-1-like [Physella acuta]
MCHDKGNCVAFSYNKTSGLCSVCSDYSVKSLVVDTGPSETFYGLRQNIQYVELSSSTNIDKRLDLSCGISVGNLIVLRGVYADIKGFIVDVKQNDNNILLHFRPRVGYVTLNHMVNGNWGSGNYFYVVPFNVGQTFVVHILVRVDSYAIFVDGKFMYSYSHRLQINNALYLNLSGNVQYADLTV